MSRETKCQKLADVYGFETIEDLLEEYITDSICPGICIKCDYTTDVEPDCRSGYCEECATQTVKSAMVLMGII